MCQGCAQRPEAYQARGWCYQCKPGTKGRPLPCRRCGTSGDYWAAGLCRRCHRLAPQLPEACRDCLAWGATRTLRWLCAACVSWRHRHPGTGECISCHRDLTLNEHQACRLCWTQTHDQARAGLPRDVLAASRAGQQLSFANMGDPRNGYRPRPRRDYRRPTDQVRPPAPVSEREEPLAPEDLPAPGPDQLDLFERDPVTESARRFGFGDPPSNRFAAQLDHHALDHAARHGWSSRQTRRTRITLRVLQARHRIQAPPVSASQLLELRAYGLPTRLALTMLADHGLLLQDRPPPLHAWFARQLAGLPEPMASELRTWFDVLHRGSTTPPRSRPRHDVTIRTRTQWAMPTLRAWAAAGHRSLREITREDVLAVLPAEGSARVKLGVALRSIFTTLKGHRVLFLNPMARMRIGNLERRVPMPIDTEPIRAVFDSPDPATAAITGLIAVHGLRPREVCALLLVDILDSRVMLPDRTILLAPATQARLTAWLTYRHHRWPGSINPHFLIHTKSATTLEQVRVPWLTAKLGMSASSLRRDRILAEVHAGGDARRLCDFFGVTISTAEHYASTLNHPDLDDSPTDAPASSSNRSPR